MRYDGDDDCAVIYCDECARDVAFRPAKKLRKAHVSNNAASRSPAPVARLTGAAQHRCGHHHPRGAPAASQSSSCTPPPSLLASLLPQDAALPPPVFLDPPVQGNQARSYARTPLVLRNSVSQLTRSPTLDPCTQRLQLSATRRGFAAMSTTHEVRCRHLALCVLPCFAWFARQTPTCRETPERPCFGPPPTPTGCAQRRHKCQGQPRV